MGTIAAVPSAPEIGVVAGSPDNPSTETTAVPETQDNRVPSFGQPSTEIIDPDFAAAAAALHAEYESAYNTLKTKALSIKTSIRELITSDLIPMQARLSQRGAEHERLRGAAGVPTWTEFLEKFKEDVGLDVTIRTLRRWIAAGRGDDKKEKRERKKRPPFTTGDVSLKDVAVLLMFTSVLEQIEKMDVPLALKQTAAECREDLKGLPDTCQRIIDRFVRNVNSEKKAAKQVANAEKSTAQNTVRAEKLVGRELKEPTFHRLT